MNKQQDAFGRIIGMLDEIVTVELDKGLSEIARRKRVVDLHNEIRYVCDRQLGFVDYIA